MQKDFDDKLKVDFGCINEINLEIVEKIVQIINE